MRATVLTALFDSYDDLKPTLQQQGAEVEWICVTDDPALNPGYGWEVFYEPRPGVHPNRAAKTPKMCPWQYTDAPWSVWIDASFLVTSPTFVVDVLAYADPLAQFPNFWRSCLYDEAEESAKLPKYQGFESVILEQAAHYRSQGMPAQWGLWATGVIARRHDDPRVIAHGERWLEECQRWSFQDQISEPFVLHEVGLRPASLPGTHFASAWLAFQESVRHHHPNQGLS